jgi:hypothetical protein
MGVKLGNGKWAIKEDKLLAYNDNSGRFFNKEFDFSRGSSATYVAKDGLIKTAGLQATNLVNNGDFSELGSELITNGNFDTDSDWSLGVGWSISNGKLRGDNASGYAIQSSVFAAGVSNIYKINLTVSDYVSGYFTILTGGGTSQSQQFNANGNYTIYLNTNNPSNTNFHFTYFGAFTGSIDNVSVKQVDPNDYWTFSGDNFSIVDGALRINRVTNTTYIQQNVLTSGKKYKVEFDVLDKVDNNGTFIVRLGSNNVYDVSTYEGTRFSKILTSSGIDFRIYSSSDNGVIYVDNISVQEIQTDTPRIDFSDSVKGALLLEPQSTNLITYSEDFTQWVKEATVTLTSNYGTSPDGTQNSTRVQMDVNDSVYISATSGNNFSIYVKGVQGETIRVANGGGLTHTLTGEWDRISLYDTGNSSSLISINTYSGATARDIEIWGAQLEALSYATSYIPNHGVSGGVTRLADVCNNSGSAQDFSESGVLYAEIANLSSSGGDGYLSLSSDDGTQNNRATIRFTATTNNLACQYVIGAVNQTSMDNILTDRTEFNKIAFLYSLNNFVVFVNGVKLSTDTSGSVLPNGTFKKLTFNNGIAAPMYAKIRNVQVFTEVLTDEQLQKLTTI